MTVTVNGSPRAIGRGASIEDLVRDLLGAPNPPGVAVARNGEVVPRGLWAVTQVGESDRIEVLHAVGGG
ncbi:MAG: sulfur carrier protein ThiS [Actinomycetota bacterium]